MPPAVDQHTLDVVAALFAAVGRGQITGIAYVVSWRRGEDGDGWCPMAYAAGELRRNPILARGMIRSLDDLLSREAGAGDD